MRSLAIIERFREVEFSNYIVSSLQSLNINHDLKDINSIGNQHMNYIVLNSIKSLVSKVLNADFCFVNMDNGFDKTINIYGNIITYGMGSRNTVTISSQEYNTSFVYCLQRYISLSSGEVIEPQEIPVKTEFTNESEVYALMIAVTIALIEGIDSVEIEKKLYKKTLIYNK